MKNTIWIIYRLYFGLQNRALRNKQIRKVSLKNQKSIVSNYLYILHNLITVGVHFTIDLNTILWFMYKFSSFYQSNSCNFYNLLLFRAINLIIDHQNAKMAANLSLLFNPCYYYHHILTQHVSLRLLRLWLYCHCMLSLLSLLSSLSLHLMHVWRLIFRMF